MLAGQWSMHTCQIGPTGTTYPSPGSPHQAYIGRQNMGEHSEAGNLSAPISPLLLVCVNGATTLSLYRILGLSVNGCWMSLR